ncbi:MAG: hypothetical protein KBS77_07325 [Bacteroidales bacterium]|nr:hypothetical protein [Candidatus Colicola faecequi]
MYNLKIYSQGIWYDADMPKDADIAITFEESGIAEMSLKGNGTQSIDLPATKTNCEIFGQLQSYQSKSRIQYSRLACRLYNDGMLIFGPGSYCILLSNTNHVFNISIIGGTCDVFTALSDVDFSVNPAALGTTRRISANGPYTDSNGIKQVPSATGALAGRMPVIPLPYIKNKLQEQTGFALPEDVFRDGYYISLVDRKRSTAWGERVAFDAVMPGKPAYRSTSGDGSVEDELYYLKSGNNLLPTEMKGIGLKATVILNYSNSYYSNIDFRFTIGYNGAWYNVYYRLNGTPLNNGFVSGYDVIDGIGRQVYYKNIIFWNDGTVTDENGAAQSGSRGFSIAAVEEKPSSMYWGFGEYIVTDSQTTGGVTVYTRSPNYPSGCIICRFQPLIQYDNDTAQAYGEMNIAENIGFKNALELYKALAQTFGYITHSKDNETTVYTLKQVANNKANAVDWTDRIVAIEVDYHADGYCQVNSYQFKKDEENSLLTQKVVVINDETLDTSQEISIGFYSGSNEAGMQYDGYNDNGDFELRKTSAPYLLKNVYSTPSIVNDEVLNEYVNVEQIMADYIGISVEIVLSVPDIYAFDHKTPVFLRQFGRYFYVQKIENYIAGRSCIAKLIAV